jgi:hypothetical protein
MKVCVMRVTVPHAGIEGGVTGRAERVQWLLSQAIEHTLRLGEPALLDVGLGEERERAAVLFAAQLLHVQLVEEDELREELDGTVQLAGLQIESGRIEHHPQLACVGSATLRLQVLVRHLFNQRRAGERKSFSVRIRMCGPRGRT